MLWLKHIAWIACVYTLFGRNPTKYLSDNVGRSITLYHQLAEYPTFFKLPERTRNSTLINLTTKRCGFRY